MTIEAVDLKNVNVTKKSFGMKSDEMLCKLIFSMECFVTWQLECAFIRTIPHPAYSQYRAFKWEPLHVLHKLKYPVPGQSWNCNLNGGSMTVSFWIVAPTAGIYSATTKIQKLVQLRCSCAICVVCVQKRLLLLAISRYIVLKEWIFASNPSAARFQTCISKGMSGPLWKAT